MAGKDVFDAHWFSDITFYVGCLCVSVSACVQMDSWVQACMFVYVCV